MTLQQLEYIIALNKYRHFVKAAESCGITQSTLSSMISKLEDELDITIFDRNARPVRPTMAGEDIIRQAQIVLFNAQQLKEITLSEKNKVSGDIHMAITPTVAPYIIPKMFSYLRQYYPAIQLLPTELRRKSTVEKLKRAEVDVAIMSMVDKDDDLLEIPLYKENFIAYISPTDPLYNEKEICYRTLPRERFWSLQNEICFLNQVNGHQEATNDESIAAYESGSLVTLMQIVDENGGFTILPQLHYPLLSPARRVHVRPIVDPTPERQVSLFVRRDYARETLLNVIADAVKTIIPRDMIDDRLAKYPIRL